MNLNFVYVDLSKICRMMTLVMHKGEKYEKEN